MRSLLAIILLWMLPASWFAKKTQKSNVPDQLIYCGVSVHLEEGAKLKIKETITKLYENPRYFNEAVDRADTYMPFIEEVLLANGVPDDWKYNALLESNLIPDAVSSSNAVGFWQFKADAAMEMGLLISPNIDERRHIYRATEASASYLKKANKDFDNWLYAVVAYYEGLTGAVKHTEPKYYGEKTMTLDEKTHWYLLRSIAYKLAFQDAVNMSRQPKTWLEPFSATGPIALAELAKKHGVSEAELKSVNKWALNGEIAAGVTSTYYVPRVNLLYTGHKPDPTRNPAGETVKPQPVVVSTPPPVVVETPPAPSTPPDTVSTAPLFVPSLSLKAIPPSQSQGIKYVSFPIKEDINYGTEYIIYDGVTPLADLALNLRKNYTDLLFWNNFTPGSLVEAGTLIYLERPKKAKYHLVKKGEDLQQIASLHQTTVEKILRKNRLKLPCQILEGQKLYLKKSKPKNEKVIVLEGVYTILGIAQEPTIAPIFTPETAPSTSVISPTTTAPASTTPATTTTPVQPLTTPATEPEVTGSWVIHTVSGAETLWGIAQRYGTKVEIIKRANNLTSDALTQGQQLKVYAKTDNPQPAVTAPTVSSGKTHTVQKQETLFQISQQYGISVDILMKHNNLSSPNIKEGQILNIPAK